MIVQPATRQRCVRRGRGLTAPERLSSTWGGVGTPQIPWRLRKHGRASPLAPARRGLVRAYLSPLSRLLVVAPLGSRPYWQSATSWSAELLSFAAAFTHIVPSSGAVVLFVTSTRYL